MKKAIYAGSFDPITNGHLWVINQASKLFDEVIVLISFNPSKQGMFSVSQREEHLKEVLKNLNNVKVMIDSKDYVANIARDEGVNYLVRGVRNFQDYEYEKIVERINQQINKEIQTIYLNPPSELSEISSSLVKSLIGFRNWQSLVEKMVPACVVSSIIRLLYSKNVISAWRELAFGGFSNEYLDIILDKYSEPHRHYHNLKHLDSLINQARVLFKEKNLSQEDQYLILYSIFFHDLVYDPKSKTNELDSANLWLDYGKNKRLKDSVIQDVYNMILATANHSTKDLNQVTKYFLDLDLSVLGMDEKTFREYENDIRAEYVFVPQEVFESERLKIMSKLVNPFKTNWAKSRWGNNASINLKKYTKGNV